MLALSAFVGFTVFGGVLGGPCDCKFQGDELPVNLINNYPSSDPGKYNESKLVKIYGTTCAAWDAIVDTPWFSYCPGGSDFSDADYNWCQQPWCYVDKECPSAVPSSVFAGDASGTAAFYSYKSCGGAANCYTNVAWNKSYKWPEGCPYDPNGDKSYMAHKSGDCACSFHGQTLNSDIYNKYPDAEPGKYQNMSLIQYYGTSCMAWDQVPGTPWSSFCPADADWCNQDYNWCQLPWCYVGSSCKTSVPSSVFKGADVAVFFSYDTCLDTPDCYSDIAWGGLDALEAAPKFCPFDVHDTGVQTAGQCPNGWTKDETFTCGDIKDDYRANKCCGNPNSPFIFGKAGKQ
eukprot:TRINITY_DN38169_c0_g2_i2.p1 TRINITY_DN38169_c0_g2~~TRINITY_DN38169_c0_g2_i2.p1  ORF type:complete len:346 (+),score=65.54 TRINITY_DN38169_c0_g2_i2:74-1111(+)